MYTLHFEIVMRSVHTWLTLPLISQSLCQVILTLCPQFLNDRPLFLCHGTSSNMGQSGFSTLSICTFTFINFFYLHQRCPPMFHSCILSFTHSVIFVLFYAFNGDYLTLIYLPLVTFLLTFNANMSLKLLSL